jgi:hypothetical protein
MEESTPKHRNEYLEMSINFNNCLGGGDFEGCFHLLQTYIHLNFKEEDAVSKNAEIILYRNRLSRINTGKRTQTITFIEGETEFNKLAKNIQEFFVTLKPQDKNTATGSLLDFSKFDVSDWDKNENYSAILVFQREFGLLSEFFSDFIKYKQDENAVRNNIFFFNGERRIRIQEGQLNSLSEDELKNIVYEPCSWKDAVIIQKKDKEEIVKSEALIIKSIDNKKIEIFSNGGLKEKSEIVIDVVNWFKFSPKYPEILGIDPFTVYIPFSSLNILTFIE